MFRTVQKWRKKRPSARWPPFRFTDEEDVIRQANDTEFGLAAYFYARDLSRVFRVGEALEYGIVGINTGLISNEVARLAA
jgi:succinate-semialdehyde dehydrogenase/glutarate-semialdehyde dehydrogenase